MSTLIDYDNVVIELDMPVLDFDLLAFDFDMPKLDFDELQLTPTPPLEAA